MAENISVVDVTPDRYVNRQGYIPGIPLDWLEKVAALSAGKAALLVALVIHREAKMQKMRSNIRLSASATDRMGVSRRSRYRALKTLESGGIISVTTNPGGSTDVALL
jgi:hypothetical protein